MLSVLSQCSPWRSATGYGREGGVPTTRAPVTGGPRHVGTWEAAAHPARGRLITHPTHPGQAACRRAGGICILGSGLLVSLWLGAALVLSVLYTHCLLLSFFKIYPHSNTDAHSYLQPFKDTLFNLWGDFEGLGIPSWATGQGSHPPKWPWVLGASSLPSSPGRRNRPSSQESLHLRLH